jgi:2-C-methyl-D-erythritol 4-phosphate cytidylyltransferase
MNRLAVILPAAGASQRFGRDKLAERIAGVDVMTRTLNAFCLRADVAEIVLVGRALGDHHARKVVLARGGTNRAESVRNGLMMVPQAVEWVAIHDAARPLVSQELISAVFDAARLHGAAAPALPVSLTIKQAGRQLPAPVEQTVPRDTLWAMQTPQIMRRIDLIDAFNRCPVPLDRVTDDVQLLELIGKPVMLVPGEESNLKITTPMDARLAEMWLEGRQRR